MGDVFILTFIDMCFPIMKNHKTKQNKNTQETGREKAKLEYFIPWNIDLSNCFPWNWWGSSMNNHFPCLSYVLISTLFKWHIGNAVYCREANWGHVRMMLKFLCLEKIGNSEGLSSFQLKMPKSFPKKHTVSQYLK